MVFASPIFLGYFLPLVLGGYHLLPSTGPARNRWLLGASYVFYGWWDPRLVPALFALTLATFTTGSTGAKTFYFGGANTLANTVSSAFGDSTGALAIGKTGT